MEQSSAYVAYDKKQDFNAITRFLHSFRHNLLDDYLDEVAAQIGDRPVRVLDIGCAMGRTFAKLEAGRHRVDYLGIDSNSKSIAGAEERYGDKPNARFLVGDAADPSIYEPGVADVVVALETLEHIPEGVVTRIVENICTVVKPRLFIASVPIEVGPALWIKTLGSKAMGYNRTTYTLREVWDAGRYRLDDLPARTGTHRGFDWRWLAQVIRSNAHIRESRSLPYRWLPKALAPSVMFVAEMRDRPSA